MKDVLTYTEARDLLLDLVQTIGTEAVPLENCCGRILAQQVIAADNVPPFDRSPYDGYAMRSADTAPATQDSPVTLRILEEIPAGSVAHFALTPGTATKVLTGSPIPEGADCVINYEATRFTDTEVTVFRPCAPGSNVVYTGEDVKKGTVLAEPGLVIDAGLMATMASQNISRPLCYRVPKIGILSTGSELTEIGEELEPGKIYNSNRYTLAGTLLKLGTEPLYLGIGRDDTNTIAALMEKGLAECDAVITTGGVSVGDYDLTPAAMDAIGVKILFRGVDLKPGMACCYGIRDGKLLCGLSGNPASSITNFHAVASAAIRKLMGLANPRMGEISVTLAGGFPKKSPATRLLRGTLDLSDGTVRMRVPKEQGNVVISSLIGCDVLAVIPAGSGPVEEGTVLKGILI